MDWWAIPPRTVNRVPQTLNLISNLHGHFALINFLKRMDVKARAFHNEKEPATGAAWWRNQFWRRFSMVTMVIHTTIIPLSIILVCLSAALPIVWPAFAFYSVLIFLDTRPERGQPFMSYQKWFRRVSWWKAFDAYFPITLHKTVDLEPSAPARTPVGVWASESPEWWSQPHAWYIWPYIILKEAVYRLFGVKPQELPPTNARKYLFAACPHGIISMGVFGALATECAGWSKLFPGVPAHLLTLTSNFYYPFYRQYIMALGISSVAKTSCKNYLNNNQNICIVVGGARESLLAEPGKFDIVLDRRYGFVKVAITTGASLVPVISFGENDIYDQVQFKPGTWIYKIHSWMAHNIGFTIPLFHARGIFNHHSGLIAYRRPINVVVGRSIDIELDTSPSQEKIEYYHELYKRELEKLFIENVDKYTPGVKLRIVE